MNINKEKIKENFSRSARSYDGHADLQKEMMHRLFAFLSRDYKRILDIGSGTGTLAEMLSKKLPVSKVIGVDFAPGMVEVASSKVNNKNIKFLLGDGEALPFRDEQFDLAVSNASLQWMDPKKVFAEVARILQPHGEFYFSTFGPATLYELRKAGLSVNDFPQEEKLKKDLSNHFNRIRLIKEMVAKHYNNVFELFFYLKETGAQNPKRVENKGLLTKKKIESLFSNHTRGIAVSYEIYYGCCRKI